MNDETTADCPRIEDISALLDGVLTGRAREEMKAHASRCPLCGAALRDFTAMSAQLQVLREDRLDVDLAAIIGPRLPPRVPAQPRAPARKKRPWHVWGDLWQLAPGGLAGAAALGAGAYLGLLLVAGGGSALRPAAMAVFDAVPPGAVCAGLPLCSPRGR
jgi:anti-sigma factor RsiW